jgi:Xaa-Pro aminopeptidase
MADIAVEAMKIDRNGNPTTFEWPVVEGYPGRRAYGTQACDWEERINFDRMRKYRFGRVKQQLQQRNIGAVLCLNEWNIKYTTATTVPYWTTPSSGLRYSLFPATEDAGIIYEQGEIGYHVKNTAPWLKKVKVAITGAGWIGQTMGITSWEKQRKKFCEQIANDLKESGVAKEILALDTWDPGLVEEFTRIGIKVAPRGQEVMLNARRIKNPDEIECLRTCSAIGDAMFATLARNLRPGIKETELVGLAHKTAYDLGARIYSGVFVTSGPYGWPNSRDESDRMIRPGDVVYMDVYNTAFEGYKICYYRTFSCGPASQRARDIYKEAYDWLYDSIAAIKAGATTRDVASRWPSGPQVWKDINIRHEDQTAGSNWAHGIGLTLYEPPIIWREVSLNEPVELEEGMTFAIETQHGVPGEFGVRIEEVIAVTKKGCEILTKWPIDRISEVPLY